MPLERRTLLLSAAAAAFTSSVGSAGAAPVARAAALSAAQFGVHPGSRDNQTAKLQRAIDAAAEARTPLFLPPGLYLTGGLRLRSGTAITGIGGASRLKLDGSGPLLFAEHCQTVALNGLVLDDADRRQSDNRGVLTIQASRDVHVEACEIIGGAGNGIHFDGVEGAITRCAVKGAAKGGIFSRNAAGLRIADNVVADCRNNGIQVWRAAIGADGTLVTGNRIVSTAAADGGSGQNGNAINLFRANGVIVANNIIQRSAFSAVRANSSSDIQIVNNNCSTLGEVALYVELGSQGAVVANNIVDGASIGLSMTNFNEGGRLGVAQGNLFRNLLLPPREGNDPNGGWGIGIHVEADTAVNGNVIENVARAGISLGWARHLRDVTATGNVIREAPIGVSVSVSAGAGSAIVKDNMIAGATQGAVVGFDRARRVTGDLARGGSDRFAQLVIAGNVVR